jgi:hypothetical protein
MSDLTTRRMIAAYYQEAEPTAFISGMFSSRPEDFHSSEEVEFDIVRCEEDVSIVVQDLSVGYRSNSADVSTNKSIKPPIHKEKIALNAHDLIKRTPGNNPFENVDFRRSLIMRMFDGMRKVERKIKRSIELQASQVMQTATVTLVDSSGTALYTVDYAGKATHFPTAGVSWATATLEQKLNDIKSLCNVIRSDGLRKPDMLLVGEDVLDNLFETTGFYERFDARRADRGTIVSQRSVGEGGIYHGTLEVGNYKLDLFTYDGRYKHPQTGVSTQFVEPGNVIVRASTGVMTASFGDIPNIGQLLNAQNRVLPEIPSRLSSGENRMDLFTNVWMSNDGEQLFAGVGARPLMIPKAIDTFGCLDTQL